MKAQPNLALWILDFVFHIAALDYLITPGTGSAAGSETAVDDLGSQTRQLSLVDAILNPLDDLAIEQAWFG